ncbi:NADH-ubiquinone oxidoreductase chain 2-like [Liolophura sinensis]|uniref:NADH-ubiquinone oxidoreductase chain 2-like n=1 Tax=Liolophura sinensis TaxID=3198878 RepID=UPI00315923D2
MVLISRFFGGVGGLNQTSIRGLLAYSSILHNVLGSIIRLYYYLILGFSVILRSSVS